MTYLKYSLLFIFLCLASCIKERNGKTSIETVKSMLRSESTKTWVLKKLYINNNETTLTPGQTRFTKTYKADDTWLDSDGHQGTYSIPNISTISEVTVNLPTGLRTTNYTIKSITMISLEVEYTLSSTSYRLIFGL